ncbi:hypothetical protein vseg_015243 [Gypsophila vaccaria]
MKMPSFLLNVTVFGILFRCSLGAVYNVGGPRGGWDEKTNLQAWGKPIKFLTGDKLVFLYAKSHDLVEVPKADYDTCEATNAIVTDDSGKSVVPLTKPGKRYFICGVPGHCASGMKLEVTVFPLTHSFASSPVTLPALPPTTVSSSPMTSPVGSSPSLPPAQPSSAGLRSSFMPFAAYLVSAFAMLAL